MARLRFTRARSALSERHQRALSRRYGRASLAGFSRRLLGFERTERLMGEIREALERAFGLPRNEAAPRSLLRVEEAWLCCDFSQTSYHFEGLEYFYEPNAVRSLAGKPAWARNKSERRHDQRDW